MGGDDDDNASVMVMSMLCRTRVHGSDGQAWRRLSVALLKSGKTQMGEMARYSAWQLGERLVVICEICVMRDGDEYR